MRAGIIGLGDMGSGLAKNLIENGFKTNGFDLDQGRLDAFSALGGTIAADANEVGRNADVVFVMVMTGGQAKSVLFGNANNGMVSHMATGSTVILTATIKPSEAREIGEMIADTGVNLIDSPVRGGLPGAPAGTRTV